MANKKDSSKHKEIVKYLDLLYMTPDTICAKDIAVLLQDDSRYNVELWDEMNVLEIELPNQSSIDFESLEVQFKDPSDAAFVKNRNIKTIFAVSLNENDLGEVVTCFETIISKSSGFLCADSIDFTPVYVGSSKQ